MRYANPTVVRTHPQELERVVDEIGSWGMTGPRRESDENWTK
jgi:hypothetical protein